MSVGRSVGGVLKECGSECGRSVEGVWEEC